MGYYMRFVIADDKDISLDNIASAFREIDPAYSVESEDDEGELRYQGDIYGVLQLNKQGDDLFGDEIDELKECLEDVDGDGKLEVVKVLNNAKAMIVLQVFQQGRATSEETLVRFDPLWEWLFRNYKGLMQADLEGYYDSRGLVLEIN